ncbi:MAG: site-specific DNA-methyltransferase [Chloroflexi bacterium]|nr:site-specific DNA-methyltransferase [Chloroflexota bacterium]
MTSVIEADADSDGEEAAMIAAGPGWSLHLGNCLTGMRTLADMSVDVTITDPPYEAEAHTKGKRQGPTSDGRVRVVDEAFTFAAITEATRLEVARQICRVTRGLALVFCQVEAVSAWQSAFVAGGMLYRRAIPWVKPDAMPSLHGRWPGQAVEMIVLAGKPGAIAPIGGKARYYECTRERRDTRAHPTAKPLELMRQIVADFSDPDDLVLDPFAGSGSTGVACRMLGRRFIGWELDSNYHAVATRRLSGDEAVPRDCQPSLAFKGPA